MLHAAGPARTAAPQGCPSAAIHKLLPVHRCVSNLCQIVAVKLWRSCRCGSASSEQEPAGKVVCNQADMHASAWSTAIRRRQRGHAAAQSAWPDGPICSPCSCRCARILATCSRTAGASSSSSDTHLLSSPWAQGLAGTNVRPCSRKHRACRQTRVAGVWACCWLAENLCLRRCGSALLPEPACSGGSCAASPGGQRRGRECVGGGSNCTGDWQKHAACAPAACPPAHTRPRRLQRSASPCPPASRAGWQRGCPAACLGSRETVVVVADGWGGGDQNGINSRGTLARGHGQQLRCRHGGTRHRPGSSQVPPHKSGAAGNACSPPCV